MTYNEGVNYLKPLIFEIHPDFFEQYPKEKEVNQNSLKLLYNYLYSLDNITSKTLSLKFYIRRKNPNTAEFALIRLDLKEQNVNNAVSEILSSCKKIINLNDKILPKKITKNILNNDKNIAFDHFRYPKDQTTNIIDWLEKSLVSEKLIRKRCLIMQNKIKEMKLKLINEHNISDIIWQSNFKNEKYFASLVSLSRVLNHLRMDLKFRKVIFTSDDKSGINCFGDMLLSCMQVEEVWKKEFQNLTKNLRLLTNIMELELTISNILGKSKITLLEDIHNTCLAKDYLTNLLKIHFTINSIRSDKFNRIGSFIYSVSDMTITPYIHNSGTIIIPAHIDSKSLLDFLNNNFSTAIHETRTEYLKQIDLFHRLKEVFVNDFNCKDVKLNVSLINGISGLKKLLRLFRLNYKTIDFDFCDLIIDYYYGTTSDGDIIIPWNFYS